MLLSVGGSLLSSLKTCLFAAPPRPNRWNGRAGPRARRCALLAAVNKTAFSKTIENLEGSLTR